MRKARGWLLYLYSGQLATFDLDPLNQSAVPRPFDVGVRIRVAASGIADVRECGLCALLMHVVVPRVVSIIDGSREPRTDHLRTVMACGRDRGSWIRFGPGAPWRCFRDPGWPLCSCRSSVGPVGRPRRPVTYFLGKRGGSRRQAHRPLANEVASSSSSQALRSTDLEGQPWTAGLGRTS